VPSPVEGGPARLIRGRPPRRPWCFVRANFGYAWATRHGGDDLTGAHALALVANYTDLWRAVLASGMVGCLLIVPALMAGMRLLRSHVPRLSLFAGSSIIAATSATSELPRRSSSGGAGLPK
jgi:hypothetical protein